jgi:hypothetical protein
MKEHKLLTRDEFREGVFARDDHKCVIYKEPAIDAHHILERRLFSDGGYYLDNGASLCSIHHILAEETTLDCNTIREAAAIENIVLPDHMYSDLEYDKWGNIILPNDNRIKGELFHDESVQKILRQGKVIDLFQKYYKYPRTYHVSWSNLLKDDRMLQNEDHFEGKHVIVTLKMDGENTSMYNDYIHARSLDCATHESRKWVKGLWSQISYLMDEDMRICGENMYAVHSVKYENLSSYFYVFSIWFDNKCISWDETIEYSKILGIETVPVIYDGTYNKDAIIKAFEPYRESNEGYVIRLADEFLYSDFRKSIAKYVRPEFRQAVNNSQCHWASQKIIKNGLKL